MGPEQWFRLPYMETIWSTPVVSHTPCPFTWERSLGLPGGQLWLRASFPFCDVQHMSGGVSHFLPSPAALQQWSYTSLCVCISEGDFLVSLPAPEGHLHNLLKSGPFSFASHIPEAQQVGLRTPFFQIRAPSTSTNTDRTTKLLSHVWLFTTPWTVACQASLSLELSRQECCGRLPFPT